MAGTADSGAKAKIAGCWSMPDPDKVQHRGVSFFSRSGRNSLRKRFGGTGVRWKARKRSPACSAHEIEGDLALERVQAELFPLVVDLREARGETEELQKQRDAEGWSWAVLAVIYSGLGGIVGGLVVLAFCW